MPLFLPFELANEWLNEELSEAKYKEILHFEMPSAELDYHLVFTIRTPKLRPDNQPKNVCWEWEKLPELDTMNPDSFVP